MTTFAGMTSAEAGIVFTGTFYCALMSAAGTFAAAGTELAAINNYARASFTFTVTPGANTSSAVPSADIVFNTPSADWVTAVAVEVYGSLGGVDRKFSMPLTTPVTGKNGVPVVILASQLTLTLGGAQV